MKLNNREVQVISKKVIAKLEENKQILLTKWKKDEYPLRLKTLQSTPLYKNIVKVFSNSFISSVYIKLEDLELSGFNIKDNYNCNVFKNMDSVKEFDKIILKAETYFIEKQFKLPSFEEVEGDVILDSLGITDVEELINKLVAKY